MSKCHYCNVEILDQTTTCPLCQGVLEYGGDFATGYPNILAQRRKLVVFRRIVTFVAIVAVVMCFYIDYHTSSPMNWSYIASGGILCGLLVFLAMTDPVAGYRKRIMTTLFASAAMVLIVDLATGFYRWSVNFVFPGMMFLIDVGLLLLMCINRRNWQSYMIYQILIILVGIVPIAMIYAGIVTVPVLSELAFGSSVLLFVGTLIFGGHEARLELSRRFHI